MNYQLDTRDLIADHLMSVKAMYRYLQGKTTREEITALKVLKIHFRDELTAMGLMND